MSKRMNKKEFDKIFDQAFEEGVKEFYQSSPDSIDIEDSWKRVEKRLRLKKKKHQWKRRVQLISVAVASLLIGALLLSPGQMTNALQPMYKLIKGFQEGVITFFVQGHPEDHSGAKTPPPPDVAHSGNTSTDEEGEFSGDVLRREEVSLGEAQEKTSFYLYVPSTLPAGYTLEQIELFYREDAQQAHTAQMEYLHSNGDFFDITQIEILPNSRIASGVNESAGIVQEVQVQGNTAYLVNFESGRMKLEWLIENVKITIIGDLNEDEILSVANSMR